MPLITQPSTSIFHRNSTSTGGNFPNHHERISRNGSGTTQQITNADLTAAALASELTAGRRYRITDAVGYLLVEVTAVDKSLLSQRADALWRTPEYTNTSLGVLGNTIYDDVWTNSSDGKVYAIGEKAIYDNLVWINLLGGNTDVAPPNNALDWVLSTLSADYGSRWMQVDFNIFVETIIPGFGVQKKVDWIGNNEAYFDLAWSLANGVQNNINFFKWGTGNLGDEGNRIYSGVMNNINSKSNHKFNTVHGGGTLDVTKLSFCYGVDVFSANVIVSGTAGGFNNCQFSGVTTLVRYTGTTNQNNIVGRAGAQFTISGDAELDGTRVNGVVNILAGGGKFKEVDVHSYDNILKIITIAADTDINKGSITTEVSMDLSGKKPTSEIVVNGERSNLSTTVEIVGGVLDIRLPAHANCGLITVESEAGLADDLDTISYLTGSNPSRIDLIPGDDGGDHVITLTAAGNLTFEAGVAGTTIDASKADSAEVDISATIVPARVIKIFKEA